MPEADREEQVADWQIKQDACPQCGEPPGVCDDPTRDWFPQRTVCFKTMAQTALQRAYDLKYGDRPYHNGAFVDWREEPDAAHLWSYNEGVTLWLSPYDLTPDEDWL